MNRVSKFSTNVKKDIPKRTLVLQVPESDVARLWLLINTYSPGMPDTLANFLEDAKKQLR